jgi:hypothetical protein
MDKQTDSERAPQPLSKEEAAMSDPVIPAGAAGTPWEYAPMRSARRRGKARGARASAEIQSRTSPRRARARSPLAVANRACEPNG